MTTIVVDEANQPLLFVRTIVVTPEPPDITSFDLTGRTSVDIGAHAALYYLPSQRLSGTVSAEVKAHAAIRYIPSMRMHGTTSVEVQTHAAVHYTPSMRMHGTSSVDVDTPAAHLHYVGPFHLSSGRASVDMGAHAHLTVLPGNAGLTDMTGRSSAVVGAHAALIVSYWTGVFELSTPEDAAVIASATPTFVVALLDNDPTLIYTIEIEYADNVDFINAVTLSSQAPVVDGGVSITPTVAVPATTFWRARLLLNGDGVVGWVPSRSFTLNTTVTPVHLPVTWTVSSAAARPIHLWHFDPPGPYVGDTVTVFGQGFPTSGHLLLGDTQISSSSWTLVPASGVTPRVIDGAAVTCEHYEVTFTAPAIDGDGDALTVEV